MSSKGILYMSAVERRKSTKLIQKVCTVFTQDYFSIFTHVCTHTVSGISLVHQSD